MFFDKKKTKQNKTKQNSERLTCTHSYHLDLDSAGQRYLLAKLFFFCAKNIWFSLVHLLQQFAFYVTVFY